MPENTLDHPMSPEQANGIAKRLELTQEISPNEVWQLRDPQTGKEYYAKTAKLPEVEMVKKAARVKLPEDSPLKVAKPLATDAAGIPTALADKIKLGGERPGFIIVEAVPKGALFGELASGYQNIDGKWQKINNWKPITAEEYDRLLTSVKKMNEQGVFHHDLLGNAQIARGKDERLIVSAYDFEPTTYKPNLPGKFQDYAQIVDVGKDLLRSGALAPDAAAVIERHRTDAFRSPEIQSNGLSRNGMHIAPVNDLRLAAPIKDSDYRLDIQTADISKQPMALVTDGRKEYYLKPVGSEEAHMHLKAVSVDLGPDAIIRYAPAREISPQSLPPELRGHYEGMENGKTLLLVEKVHYDKAGIRTLTGGIPFPGEKNPLQEKLQGKPITAAEQTQLMRELKTLADHGVVHGDILANIDIRRNAGGKLQVQFIDPWPQKAGHDPRKDIKDMRDIIADMQAAGTAHKNGSEHPSSRRREQHAKVGAAYYADGTGEGMGSGARRPDAEPPREGPRERADAARMEKKDRALLAERKPATPHEPHSAHAKKPGGFHSKLAKVGGIAGAFVAAAEKSTDAYEILDSNLPTKEKVKQLADMGGMLLMDAGLNVLTFGMAGGAGSTYAGENRQLIKEAAALLVEEQALNKDYATGKMTQAEYEKESGRLQEQAGELEKKERRRNVHTVEALTPVFVGTQIAKLPQNAVGLVTNSYDAVALHLQERNRFKASLNDQRHIISCKVRCHEHLKKLGATMDETGLVDLSKPENARKMQLALQTLKTRAEGVMIENDSVLPSWVRSGESRRLYDSARADRDIFAAALAEMPALQEKLAKSQAAHAKIDADGLKADGAHASGAAQIKDPEPGEKSAVVQTPPGGKGPSAETGVTR